MTSTPALVRFHHVTLSVSDLDRSVAWYRDVLGFNERRRVALDGLQKAMLERDDLVVTFVDHGPCAQPGSFDERRTGLDHLSFAVADDDALGEWVRHLDAHDVPRGEVTQATTGAMVAFRDPDNIALEFYTA